MACTTCESINFLPIEHWGNYDIENPMNAAFAPYQKGHLDYVYYVHHSCLLDLVHSARRGCYFCAILWHGLTLDSETIQNENTAAYCGPIILRIWSSTEWQSWQDCPIGEFISVFLGSTRIRLERVSPPTGTDSCWFVSQLSAADISPSQLLILQSKPRGSLGNWSAPYQR